MRALSIRQTFAWLILHGGKDIENRTWRTAYRGPLLVHAPRQWDQGGWDILDQVEAQGPTIPPTSNSAGIVGQVDVVDCVSHSTSPWFIGPFGLVLRNPRPLAFVPCRGRLKLFDIDYGLRDHPSEPGTVTDYAATTPHSPTPPLSIVA